MMYAAALALFAAEPLTRINALKNVLSATVGLMTPVVFAAFDRMNRAAALTVAPAAIIGGCAGARLARRLPPRALRYVIVTFGTAIGRALFYRAFLG